MAGIGVITHHLGHTQDGHLGLGQVGLFPSELVSVWWIWATHTIHSNRFDTFDRLNEARRLRHEFHLVYSNLLFVLGMGMLASVIGHAITRDLDRTEFLLLAVAGRTLFYLGKQVIYFHVFPPYRSWIVVNTLVCVSVTVAATFLPRVELTLIGMTGGLVFYVFSNYRWTFSKNVSAYLEEHHTPG
ncbi:MAG: hypothetical protein P1V81_08575 [Planctomycetota bacterium]|nr:hypothetical protein [Planctomycetota bacterium]